MSLTNKLSLIAAKSIGVLKQRTSYINLIAAFLIVLFVYTATSKILHFEKFMFEIGRSPFIEQMATFIAYIIPISELLIAAALAIQKTRLAGLYASAFLMALFTGYIWLMLTYAHDLPCSCGGILAEMTWKDHLYFNLAATLLSITGVVLQIRQSNATQNTFHPIINHLNHQS